MKARPFFDDAKKDFDSMNDNIFPAVMNKMATGGTNILPGFRLASLPEGWRTGLLNYFADRSRLGAEREDAWDVGRDYASMPALITQVVKMPTSSTVTRPSLI